MDLDISAITSIISNVGFPIAVCIYFAIAIRKDGERHTLEVDELRKVVEQNTLIVQRLVDKLEGVERL